MLICVHSLAEIETHQMVIELLVETVSQPDRRTDRQTVSWLDGDRSESNLTSHCTGKNNIIYSHYKINYIIFYFIIFYELMFQVKVYRYKFKRKLY